MVVAYRQSDFTSWFCLGTGNDGSVVDMIRRRTSDTKVGVRKAGLQVLEALVLMDTSSTRISVSVFGCGCVFYSRRGCCIKKRYYTDECFAQRTEMCITSNSSGYRVRLQANNPQLHDFIRQDFTLHTHTHIYIIHTSHTLPQH